MRKIVAILYLLGFSLGTSCRPVVTATITPTSEGPMNWWTTWLTQPVCQPPCWQNITPGVTTIDEAASILENMPDVVITAKRKDRFSWNYGTKTEGGNIITSEDGKVSVIWLGNASNTSLSLEEIVAVYGVPEYVKPYDCREGMCVTVLIYPDSGLLLDIFIENTGTIDAPQLEILSDTIVDRVYFIEPGMENFQKLLDFQDYDLLMEWKGYGKYP